MSPTFALTNAHAHTTKDGRMRMGELAREREGARSRKLQIHTDRRRTHNMICSTHTPTHQQNTLVQSLIYCVVGYWRLCAPEQGPGAAVRRCRKTRGFQSPTRTHCSSSLGAQAVVKKDTQNRGNKVHNIANDLIWKMDHLHKGHLFSPILILLPLNKGLV